MIDTRFLLLLLLGAMLLVLLVLAFSGPSADRARTRRLAAVKVRYASGDTNQIEARMKKVIAARKVDGSQLLVSLIPNPERLAARLAMTGKKWTLSQYMMASGGLALVLFTLLSLRGFSFLPSFFVSIAAGLGLPHYFVGKLISRRINKFNASFPDALDLLVRGLRSGLPVSETMNVVGREIPGPVGEEFRQITERVKIGKSMDQALQDTAKKLGTAEFQFFCITLAIQRETGGNLAETLANLGGVLRQRAQMKLKIRAMSSESKASAYIIGALPFLVFGLGLMQIIGLGGMGWMGIGVFIMSKMINFEI